MKQKKSSICKKCKLNKSISEFPKINDSVRSKVCFDCLEIRPSLGKTKLNLNKELTKEGKRFCISCDTIKPIVSFNLDKHKTEGYKSMCRACAKSRLKQNKIKSAYGITMKEYNSIYDLQNQVCAICNTDIQLNNNFAIRACLDHNHTTGKVRGLLCSNCNRALGLFKDRIDLLISAAKYLKKHDHLKPCELLETPEEDNQQPSFVEIH